MSVGRTALWLVPLALLARGAGFVVPLVIAGWYGVRAETDAFFFALSVPSFLLVLASNAMGTVAVPHLAALRHRSPERLPGVVSGAAGAAALASLTTGTCFALALPSVLPRISSFDTATSALAVRDTWLLLPFVALAAALAVVRAACEVSGAFKLASLAPVARATANLLTVGLAFGIGSDALPLGMVVGGLAECAWLVGRPGPRSWARRRARWAPSWWAKRWSRSTSWSTRDSRWPSPPGASPCSSTPTGRA
jgi:peptidoglycan biosynthesis protein MviN/MurJ (putative lipid II flippase)